MLDRATGEARSLALAGQQTVVQITDLKERIRIAEQTAALLTSIGELRQNSAQEKIESLVTRGLQTIFGEDMSFHMVQTVKSNASNVDFVIRSKVGDSIVETPVLDSRGGGLAAVVGFLVRLVILLLSNTGQRVMFLDETFAHVSAEYEPRLAEFIRSLVEHTGVQIVMVTHSTAYSDVADKIYHFSLKDGITQIREGAAG